MLVDVDELDHARIGFTLGLDDKLDHVFRVVEAVEQQCRLGIEGFGQADIRRVALHQIGVVIGAHQLHGFYLQDFDLLRVGDDVFFSGLVAHPGLRVIKPALASSCRPRPLLIGSLAIATLAP